jgi:hypothetical protein
MNKDLIELQRGCPATAVVVFGDEYKSLGNVVIMKAKISDRNLFGMANNEPIFKDKLEEVSKVSKLVYFVIDGIDKLFFGQQNRFLGLVKDREFGGYKLPKNCIIVFTAESKLTLRYISNELFHFCVVA